MFPTPIEKRSETTRVAYQAVLPIALLFWLLPLIAVAVFSIKPEADFTNANYWGLPTSFEGAANYGRVFFDSDMPRYLLNSVLITVPTVIGAGGVEKVIDIQMNKDEQDMFDNSVNAVKGLVEACKGIDSSLA